MSRQIAGRFWKWVIPAGITLGIVGLWAPARADDDKDPDVKKVVIKKDGDEERKDGDRISVKKEERKEDGRKEDGRKDEPVKKGGGGGHNDARIDELAGMVKQLAGQVNELREEVRGLRGGFPGIGNPDEYRKRMEEMAKKFGAANPASISPEKMKEEMERRFKEQKERFARDAGIPGGDAEVQIRREIERLQIELKRIIAAREGGDKERKEPKKELSDDEAREAKEQAARREAKIREAREREAKEREADEREAKERAAKEAKERDAKERDAKEDKKPESK